MQRAAGEKSTGKSRITNWSHVLPGVDGRSAWARHFRDLMELHIADLGGYDVCRKPSTRWCGVSLRLKLGLEPTFATSDEASATDLDLYERTSNTMRRHFETLGLARRAGKIWRQEARKGLELPPATTVVPYQPNPKLRKFGNGR
jgi:hypothetical protein